MKNPKILIRMKKPRVVIQMGERCPYYSLSKGESLPHGLRDIIITHVETPLKNHVAGRFEAIVKNAAEQLKKWALAHYKIARHLEKSTVVFEKILSDPVQATRQLAAALMKNGHLGAHTDFPTVADLKTPIKKTEVPDQTFLDSIQ